MEGTIPYSSEDFVDKLGTNYMTWDPWSWGFPTLACLALGKKHQCPLPEGRWQYESN